MQAINIVSRSIVMFIPIKKRKQIVTSRKYLFGIASKAKQTLKKIMDSFILLSGNSTTLSEVPEKSETNFRSFLVAGRRTLAKQR